MMFMYKLNLQNLNESNWIGSKICLKKYFPGAQKLRDLKLNSPLTFEYLKQKILDEYNFDIENNSP